MTHSAECDDINDAINVHIQGDTGQDTCVRRTEEITLIDAE